MPVTKRLPSGHLRKRVRDILSHSDIQQQPMRAISKRIWYRLRWRLTSAPWVMWLDGKFMIETPRGGSGAQIFYWGCSEPKGLEVLKRLLKPGMTFVDIGAHIGEYTMIGSDCVGSDGQVYAFEPSPNTRQILERNLRRNGLSNVTIVSSAVSDSDGFVEFTEKPDPRHSRITTSQLVASQSSGAVLTVPRVRLDAWSTSRDDLPISVIKIDIEGHEAAALSGATAILNRSGALAPVIMFEYAPTNWFDFGATFEGVEAFFRNHGYEVLGFSSDTGFSVVSSSEEAIRASNQLNLLLIAAKPEHVLQDGSK